MRTKVFKYGGDKFFYKINNADDLLDTDRFSGITDDDIKATFGTGKKRQAKQMAKRAFFDMMILIAYDMIFHQDFFVFPRVKWGVMAVSDTTDTSREDYVYTIATNGTYLKPQLIRDRRVKQFRSKRYYIRFNKDWRRSIWNKLEKYGSLKKS